MKQIIIRAYRVNDSTDIAVSVKELLDYLNTDMDDNIGNDEKLLALNDALNNREHNIPVYPRLSLLSVDPSINKKDYLRTDYMLLVQI